MCTGFSVTFRLISRSFVDGLAVRVFALLRRSSSSSQCLPSATSAVLDVIILPSSTSSQFSDFTFPSTAFGSFSSSVPNVSLINCTLCLRSAVTHRRSSVALLQTFSTTVFGMVHGFWGTVWARSAFPGCQLLRRSHAALI